MKGTLVEKSPYPNDVLFKREKQSHISLNSNLLKKRKPRRGSRLSGRPQYIPIGPLGPNPLNAVPLNTASESGRSPLASGFPLGDMREGFVSRHLAPVAEFFVLIHPMSLRGLLEKLEIEIIRNVLTREKGNVKKAARFLDIKYTTLYSKVKKYAIEPVRFETPGN